MNKILILFLTTLLATGSCVAIELGSFKITKANIGHEQTRLALIDTSEPSLKWLSLNVYYIVKNKIPVLVLDSNQQEVTKLNEKYNGLLAGVVPEPSLLINKLVEQIGIPYYPAVIENGVVWQENPKEKK